MISKLLLKTEIHYNERKCFQTTARFLINSLTSSLPELKFQSQNIIVHHVTICAQASPQLAVGVPGRLSRLDPAWRPERHAAAD